MFGGDRIELVQTERVELVQIIFTLARVEFVDREENRLVGSAQPVRRFGVQRIESALAVEQEHDDIGFRHRQMALRLDVLLELAGAFGLQSAGVDE